MAETDLKDVDFSTDPPQQMEKSDGQVGEWEHGLCSSCAKPGGFRICALTTFCPCIVLGQNVRDTGGYFWAGILMKH